MRKKTLMYRLGGWITFKCDKCAYMSGSSTGYPEIEHECGDFYHKIKVKE